MQLEDMFDFSTISRRRMCRRRRECNPLFRAVLSDDLKELKSLVESGNSVNIQNTRGSSLLNFVMRRKRVEIFDYLLTLDKTDVNFLDRLEQAPLVYLAGVCFDEYFALELIKKGADIHLTDDCGFTFLHLAAKSDTDDNLNVGQIIIERGADINQQAHHGITPLYSACEVGNFDWICMLLYYGADATIPTDRGVLPLAALSQSIPEEQQLHLQEILFNYTFDKEKYSMNLPTLVAAMTLTSMLFPKILDNISDVDYTKSDLQYMVSSLIHVKPAHLKLFIEKFGYIVRDMIINFSPMDVLIKIAIDWEIIELKEILDVFINSEYILELIQSSDPTLPTISRLLEFCNNPDHSVEQEDVTEMICLMLTYGLGVTSTDLDAVYNHYGYCELFKILLHMNITLTNSNNDGHSVAVLFYLPTSTIDDFLNNPSASSALLDYYNHPRLKEIVLANSESEETTERVKNLPQVPYLVEFSRNAARKYIVDRFNIKNSVQFYTVLQWLPIGDMNRRIIALERKLY